MDAAQEVISEIGYDGATFQAIASAGLHRDLSLPLRVGTAGLMRRVRRDGRRQVFWSYCADYGRGAAAGFIV
jgi:hypothetical protein